MNIELLGRDETKPSRLGFNVVFPTAFTQTEKMLIAYINSQYSWDILNPAWYSAMGFMGGSVTKFIEDYLKISIERKESLSTANKSIFKNYLVSNYDYTPKKAEMYLDGMIHLIQLKRLPEPIYKPYAYTATTLTEDIGKAVSVTAGFTAKNIMPWVLGGLAIYAGLSTFAPKLVASYIKK